MPRSNLQSRPMLAALTAIAMGAACFQGAGEGPKAPKAASAGDSSAFRVVYAAPSGEATGAGEITLVMNRPMRALDLAGDEAPPFATLSPEVRGSWQWVGTSGLLFVPERRLPKATAFRVQVPAGTKALDGSALEKAFTLELSTERPEPIEVKPRDGASGLPLDAAFTVRFNQPIDERSLAAAASLAAGGKPIAVDIRRPEPDDEALFTFAPRQRLPANTEVRLTIDKALRGREGPLEAGKSKGFGFRTFGPLRVVRGRCAFGEAGDARCLPDAEMYEVLLSNPVDVERAKAAIEIEPAVPITVRGYDEDHGEQSLYIHASFAPSTKYRIRVRKDLTDKYGQTLGADWVGAFEMGPLDPYAVIGLEGTIFEPSARSDIPIFSVNTPELRLATAPVDEKSVLELFKQKGELDLARLTELTTSTIGGLAGGKKLVVKPASGLNKPASELISVGGLLDSKTQRGAFALGLEYTPKAGADAVVRSAVVQVTDLAITAKASRNGSLVRVSRLSTGEPVAGSSVSVRRPADKTPPEVFTTDANGFATIPAEKLALPASLRWEEAVLFARSGDDWAFRAINDTVEVGDVWPSLYEPPAFGFIWTERKIYRPGEVVHIKGILRREARAGTDRRYRTPAGEAVEVRVRGYSEVDLAKRTVTTTPFGTFWMEAKIPAEAKLGHYRIDAKVGGEEVESEAYFEVAEYRPNELAISVTSDRPSYMRGEKATFTVQGEQLSGPPAAGAEARVMVHRTPTDFSPPGLEEGFGVGDAAYGAERRGAEYRYMLQSTKTKLDARGRMVVPAVLAPPGQYGPEAITCEAEMGDGSGERIAGRVKTILHPAEVYVGLNSGVELFARAKTAFQPRVVVVDTKGARSPAKVPVRVELIHRVYKETSYRGRSSGSDSFEDRVVSSCDVVAEGAPASCPVKAERAGSYIVRASAADKNGNETASSTWIYVTGEGAEPAKAGDPLLVELVPDKKIYDIGQTARIFVKSPFPTATALVTVERAGIYSKRTASLSGAAPVIEVPVTDELWPNAFVSVILTRPVRGLKGGASEAMRVGYARLEIKPDARRLRVDVKPSARDAAPGSQVEVEVEVRDRAGRPVRAEVALYAVDKGVISLTGEARPDPAAHFATPKPLRVATIESREDLARVLSMDEALRSIGSIGHGAGSVTGRERRDFRTTAFYNPALVTDAKGRAKATFTLPDSLTSYRITAVASAEDDKTGSADAEITASLPLMVRPALPRVLRAGDEVSLGALITSRQLGSANVDIEVSAEGLTPMGELRRRVVARKDEPVEVRFPFSAQKVGAATIRFAAKADGGASDLVTVKREVRPPALLEAVALYGQTEATAREKLGDLSAMRDDMGGLELRLSSTALVGLDGGFEQLLQYPYGCTEQLTSRLVPLVSLRELAKAYDIELPSDIDARIAEAVTKILAAQKSGGGFGFWPDSPSMNDWATAYATWGLVEAKRAGARVPAKAIEDALAYLRGALNQDSPGERAERAFIVDMVASAELVLGGRVSAPIQKKIMAIFEDREALSPSARAMLAHAMAIGGADAASLDKIRAELEGHVRLDGPLARAVVVKGSASAELLDSEARTTALVLRALVAITPAHPMASRLARGLVADRRGGAWRSTQETAWSLLALDHYRRAQEPAAPDFSARAMMGSSEVFKAPFKQGSPLEAKHAVGLSGLASQPDPSLTFMAEGKGTLFYEARLRYARRELPARPLERGFYIQRMLRAVTPEGLSEALATTPRAGQTAFKAGDLVLADVLVMTPSPRRFVAIEDPLPAGLEPVDTGLASTSEYLAKALSEADFGSSRAYASAWAREELRDDRALFFLDHMPAGMYRFRYLARAMTPGSFVVPPSKAEEMYAPEVFGRSGAAKVTVTSSASN